MSPTRFRTLSQKYRRLKVALLGDFCLDRYLEIDPGKKEISLETGLPVHNVINVRAQPGGAGTVLNNLSALGVGRIIPVSFCGEDAEGFELRRALAAVRGVVTDHFFATPLRRTFTYCKPTLVRAGRAPKELNRLDTKNWTATPAPISNRLIRSIQKLAPGLDALIVLDQTDRVGTGVITPTVLRALKELARRHPKLLILADSRRGLVDFPDLTYKMNRAELSAHVASKRPLSLAQTRTAALAVAQKTGHPVFITLARHGIMVASRTNISSPDASFHHSPSLPLRGKIDIVGAGDAVTANLAAALASGATLPEAIAIANAAASVVIHKLATTGTASPQEISFLLR
jgi:rfaE bifunctional protein kinase chain/domain